MTHPTPPQIYAADFGALMVLLGSFAGILPVVAGFLACIWYGLQIWESVTVKRWFGRE